MIRWAQSPATLLLAVVLAITSVSISAAHGAMGAAGAMILCPTGAEAAIAPVPANTPRDQGEPACWGCTLAAPALPGARALTAPLRPIRSAHPHRDVPAVYTAGSLPPQARAPPLFV